VQKSHEPTRAHARAKEQHGGKELEREREREREIEIERMSLILLLFVFVCLIHIWQRAPTAARCSRIVCASDWLTAFLIYFFILFFSVARKRARL
jgi:hypothetical protein